MLKHSVKPHSQLAFFNKKFKPQENKSYRPPLDPTPFINSFSTKPLTLDQKKTLGLCFTCGDNFFPSHKCKFKGFHYLNGEELSDAEDTNPDTSFVSPSEHIIGDDSVLIIMCTVATSSPHKRFKFKAQIGQIDIIAIIDSGSTHSFINPLIVQALSLSTFGSSPLTVTIASGSQMTSSIVCANLIFQLQDHVFSGNFQVLQVAGIDLILSMDRLHSYSPITMDCHKGILFVYSEGVHITLTVQPVINFTQ
jgi:Retroviral aspartyl protease